LLGFVLYIHHNPAVPDFHYPVGLLGNAAVMGDDHKGVPSLRVDPAENPVNSFGVVRDPGSTGFIRQDDFWDYSSKPG